MVNFLHFYLKYGIIMLSVPKGGTMYKEGTIMVSQTHIERVFFRATELLFPELTKNDPRYIKVAAYARKRYFNKKGNRICVLCAIPGATSRCFKAFYAFCRRNALNPGRREVVISDMDLMFTEDYSFQPELVD